MVCKDFQDFHIFLSVISNMFECVGECLRVCVDWPCKFKYSCSIKKKASCNRAFCVKMYSPFFFLNSFVNHVVAFRSQSNLNKNLDSLLHDGHICVSNSPSDHFRSLCPNLLTFSRNVQYAYVYLCFFVPKKKSVENPSYIYSLHMHIFRIYTGWDILVAKRQHFIIFW